MKFHRIPLHLLTLLMVFMTTVSPSAVLAEDDQSAEDGNTFMLEGMEITANKRKQSLQKVPASVSAIDDVHLEDYKIETVEDIFANLPNIHMVKTGPAASLSSFASVRGITSSMGGSPVLGLYVDDIYYPSLDMSLLDLERVEVLRGPQGTLYGRNTEAGVINIVTKQPTDTYEGKLMADYGSYNAHGVKGMLSGPLISDTVLVRFAGSYSASDGYLTNAFDDDDEVVAHQEVDFRGKIALPVKDKGLNLSLTIDSQNYDSDGYADFSDLDNSDPYEVNVDFPGEAWKDAYGLSLRASYDFDSIALTSITSYRDEASRNDNDTDFSPADVARLLLHHDVNTYSQEVRLTSTDEGTPLEWQIGAYGYIEEFDRNYVNYMNMSAMGMGTYNFVSDSKTDSTGGALFSQASYTLWDKLTLTAGLRYDHIYREIDYSMDNAGMMPNYSGENSKSFEAWLPKFSASYKLTPNLMPYISIARGFREGGFNVKERLGESYKSEFAWNYEAGVKSSWLDNTLTANLSAYYIDWKDRQVEIISAGTFVMDNAGEASSTGLEFEVGARPIEGLHLTASLGYVDATYDSYDNGRDDFSGNNVISTPEYTARLGATYRFENGIFLGANYNHFGKSYTDPANTQSQSDYGLMNAKIGYEKDRFSIYAWGDNIFDTEYYTRKVPRVSMGTLADYVGRPGSPATFGVSVAVNF
jgi:iron complex outermembrane receptor protein